MSVFELTSKNPPLKFYPNKIYGIFFNISTLVR